MITRYEQLRRKALSGSVDGAALGWALFVRRGMAEWIRAWSKTAAWGEVPEEHKADRREREVGDSAGILPLLAAEVTTVLAGMALSYLRTDSVILSGDSR